MEGFLVFIGIIVVSIGLSLAISAIITACYDHCTAKRKKAHPQLWQWFDECHSRSSDECEWYNEKIRPLKIAVDDILREWNYYPTETKSQKEVELEDLRKAIETATKIHNEMSAETEKVRAKIHHYVKEHNLKWAEGMGW